MLHAACVWATLTCMGGGACWRLVCGMLAQDGQGTLHYAARKNLVRTATMLLDAGVDPDVTDQVRACVCVWCVCVCVLCVVLLCVCP